MGNSEPPQPWDQLPDEPNAAYSRFLVYLKLGRTRTLERAYGAEVTAKKREKTRRGSKVSISGTWAADCAKFDWIDRARAWDIDVLTGVGYDTVIDFMNTLALLSRSTLEGMASGKVKIRSLKTVLGVVNILGSFIPAETVAAIRADAEKRRISAIGNSGGKVTE